MSYMGNIKYGMWWFRPKNGRLYVLKAPWCPLLFSERYSFDKSLISFMGWRVFVQL